MTRTPRRRLDHARETLPAALQTLGELRRSIIAGHTDAVLLALVDELEHDLYAVEGEVGCAAPASLFEGQ